MNWAIPWPSVSSILISNLSRFSLFSLLLFLMMPNLLRQIFPLLFLFLFPFLILELPMMLTAFEVFPTFSSLQNVTALLMMLR